ncbi:MAG: endonuclease/exonuclease/phosphatase family protein [Prevotella sp.]|nr:endonuclease/exonuclease/phosphatase family protein [Prevotella sp.]
MPILKNILLSVFTGASVMVAAATVAVAYSDRLDPIAHPVLACAGMVFPIFLVANLVVLLLWLMVKWRRVWIPIAAFVLAFPSIRIFMPLHTSSEAPEGCIKVLSYNVAAYGGNYRYNQAMDTIFGYLKQQKADIVCFQEDMTVKFNPVEHFPELYPYNDTVHVTPPGYPLINAVGIHSRFPIIRRERISYESLANGSVAFFLQIGADTVIVVNNHLESTHLSTDDRQRYKAMMRGDMDRASTKEETRLILDKLSKAMAQRAEQAKAVSRYIEQHRGYPLIVCGDFNDTPISYVRRTIAQGLTDCYVDTGNGLGLSYNQRGFNFRIDHIMCSSHFKPYNCYVDDKMDASDHYPIICWLERSNM